MLILAFIKHFFHKNWSRVTNILKDENNLRKNFLTKYKLIAHVTGLNDPQGANKLNLL